MRWPIGLYDELYFMVLKNAIIALEKIYKI